MNPLAHFLAKDFSGKLLFIHFQMNITLFGGDMALVNRLMNGLGSATAYSTVFNRGHFATVICDYLSYVDLQCDISLFLCFMHCVN